MYLVKINGSRIIFGTFKGAYAYAMRNVGASWPKQIEVRNGQEVTR